MGIMLMGRAFLEGVRDIVKNEGTTGSAKLIFMGVYPFPRVTNIFRGPGRQRQDVFSIFFLSHVLKPPNLFILNIYLPGFDNSSNSEYFGKFSRSVFSGLLSFACHLLGDADQGLVYRCFLSYLLGQPDNLTIQKFCFHVALTPE